MIDMIFHALEGKWHTALCQSEAYSQAAMEIIGREDALSRTCQDSVSKLSSLSDAYAKREAVVALESFRLGFQAAYTLTMELRNS